MLFAEPVQQNPIAYACGVRRTRTLESHEASVGRYDRVRSFSAFVIVKIRQTRQILPGAVQLKLPYVDIRRAAFSPELLALPVHLDESVLAIRKNSFDLVIGAGSFRHV